VSTASLLELSSRILDGKEEITDHHPFRPSNTLEEVGDGVAFVESFANVTALATPDGLCLVDTGSALVAGAVHEAVRSWSSERATTAVYTHGHIDHVFGVDLGADARLLCRHNAALSHRDSPVAH
jgi:glyoxylase-like metal-dependent hydrolase (beta-lactamase superfamily II)